MQDPKILILISKHLSGNETAAEKEELSNWLSKDEQNLNQFNEIVKIWSKKLDHGFSIKGRITREKIQDFFMEQILGNLIGFAVGLWVTRTFTHYVTEKKSIKNLFGLAKRKKVLVNDIPEWVQIGISFILGFIALELINYFFKTKRHIQLWNFAKSKFQKK